MLHSAAFTSIEFINLTKSGGTQKLSRLYPFLSKKSSYKISAHLVEKCLRYGLHIKPEKLFFFLFFLGAIIIPSLKLYLSFSLALAGDGNKCLNGLNLIIKYMYLYCLFFFIFFLFNLIIELIV